MYLYYLCLFYVLLPLDPPPWVAKIPGSAAMLRRVLVDIEVNEPAEVNPGKADAHGFTLAREWWNQVKDAPPASDAHRFPLSADHIEELLGFNWEYQRWLEWRRLLDPYQTAACDVALAEAQEIRRLYFRVRDVRRPHQGVWMTRLNLKDLRDSMSVADWYAGRLPPHVPVWRIPRD